MTTLTAVYDFAVAPASYDFVSFLCTTGMAAERGGCQHVHIVFVPADTPDGWRQDPKPISAENKAWRRDNLLIPLCRLIGATHSVCATRAEARKYLTGLLWPAGYTLEEPIAAYWQGKLIKMAKYAKLPDFRVDPEAQRLVRAAIGERPYLTVTERNTTYGDARNSNAVAWADFYTYATHRGWKVVTIPDTERAAESGGIGALAAVNPLLRHALYHGAQMNLGTNTGPMALCYFGGLPYLMFKMVADYFSTRPEFFAQAGIPVGSQYPWSRPDQRMIWQDDTFDAIKSTFEETMGDSRQVA
jgi:hypothetical protein